MNSLKKSKLFARIKKHWQLVLIIVIYILSAFIRLDWFGLQYDEVLFANVARIGVDSSFIHQRLFKIPIMHMPYIGTTKAYFFLPLLLIFSPSVWLIRLPMIILTAISLYFFFEAIRTLFGKNIAMYSGLLLSLNPDFVFLTTYDVGPNALEFFLRSFSFYQLVKYTKNQKIIYISLFAISSIIGIYNKFNFIWYLAAILPIWFLIWGRNLINKKLIILFSIPLFLFAIFFVSNSYWKEIEINTIADRIVIVFDRTVNMLHGGTFYSYLGGEIKFLFPFGFLLAVSILIIITGIILIKERNVGFIYGLFVLILFQIVVTSIANAPWHTFFLLPYITLLITIISYRFKKHFPMITLLIFIMIIANYTFVNAYQIKNHQIITSNIWTKSINELIIDTKNSDGKFISVDWGIHNQLILFDPIKDKYFDFWSLFMDKGGVYENPELKNWFAETFLSDENTSYILRSDEFMNFPETKNNFLRLVREYGYEIKNIKVIYDRDIPMFEIIRISKEN